MPKMKRLNRKTSIFVASALAAYILGFFIITPFVYFESRSVGPRAEAILYKLYGFEFFIEYRFFSVPLLKYHRFLCSKFENCEIQGDYILINYK